MTFNNFLAKYPDTAPLFASHSPIMAPQQFKTNSSRMCTRCLTPVYCSVNMQSPLFYASELLQSASLALGRQLYKGLGKDSLSSFWVEPWTQNTHKKSDVTTSTHAKNMQEMRYLKAEHKTSYLRVPSPGVNTDGKPRTITTSGVNIGDTIWPFMCARLRKESWTLT